MQRIALPDWSGRISPVFDAARRLLLVDVDNGREVGRRAASLTSNMIPKRVDKLVNMGVDVLICGGISNPLLRSVQAAGIDVQPWRSGLVQDVLDAYLAGSLTNGQYSMPGKRGPRGRRYRGGRGGRKS